MSSITAARRILTRRLPPPPRLTPAFTRRRSHSTAAIEAAPSLPQPAADIYTQTPHPAAAAAASPRLARIKTAKPFSSFLTDHFQRQHNYLRISITERCNLRCLYCMPEEGVTLSPPAHLLSTPEILELARVFVAQGVTKIRLTGGEPTVRRDVVELVEALGALHSMGLQEIAMTSNGVALSERKLQRMVDGGLTALNLSLDTLVPAKFEFMTRRKGLERVLGVVEHTRRLGFGAEGGPGNRTLKINVVVMRGVNEDEIVNFVEMTREREMEVRFIEYMPFDGNKWAVRKMFPYADMLTTIRTRFPDFVVLPKQRANDTAKTFHVPGFKGRVGFITSMTENFCGTCNRLRITGDGNIKACLFSNEEVSLRDVLREHRARDDAVGAGTDRARLEARLLEVVGGAVGRKEEGHKPADELARGENRPMILIDNPPRSVSNGIYGSSSSSSLSVPLQILTLHPFRPHTRQIRQYSSSSSSSSSPPLPSLPHLTSSGTAHMVPIHTKSPSTRTAVAAATVSFSNPTALRLILTNSNKKGDVLALARISGIMAAKKCPDFVVLCHPVAISSVEVDVEAHQDEGSSSGRIKIKARVTCEGKTGVEMEALTAVVGAALAVVDMCKAVDKGIVVGGVRVVEKRGGRSGDYFE